MTDEPEQLTIIFSKPIVWPGTPEAERAGCQCRFEINMEAAFLAAESLPEGKTIVVIKEGCPLHRIVRGPGVLQRRKLPERHCPL